jgi:hypothetical protein
VRILSGFGPRAAADTIQAEGHGSGDPVVNVSRIGFTKTGRLCNPNTPECAYRVEHGGAGWEIYEGPENVGSCRKQLDALRLVQQAIEQRSLPATRVFD